MSPNMPKAFEKIKYANLGFIFLILCCQYFACFFMAQNTLISDVVAVFV
jgi:hypothetical protein